MRSGSDKRLEKFTEIKRELDDYRSGAAKRAALIPRTKWLEQEERPTKLFLNLERKHVRDKTINALENEDGKLLAEIVKFEHSVKVSMRSYVGQKFLPRTYRVTCITFKVLCWTRLIHHCEMSIL